MQGTKKSGIGKRISFVMICQEGYLRFIFNGADIQTIKDVFNNMSRFCSGYQIATGKGDARIINGRCQQSIDITVTDPHLDTLPGAEWPIMIERFLRKKILCDVIYFEDLNKFLNA